MAFGVFGLLQGRDEKCGDDVGCLLGVILIVHRFSAGNAMTGH
jgi:hypothetical protein